MTQDGISRNSTCDVSSICRIASVCRASSWAFESGDNECYRMKVKFKRTVYKIPNMSKYTIFSLMLIAVFFSVMTTFAQDDDWQTLIFANNKILRVTVDGLIDNIALPEEAQDFHSGNTAFSVALSPDQKTFVFVTEENNGNGFNSTINLANLDDNTCCTVIPTPDGNPWEVSNLGVFSSDSRYLAINFISAYIADNDSLLAILDVETGEYVNTIDPQNLFNTNAVYFINWNDDGIEVIPTCFPCGASADGFTQLWNPETNEITEKYGFNASLMGSMLGTGEIIQGAQDENFPIGNADVMIGPFNVIQYFTEDNLEDVEIIYFNPDNLNLIDIEWVIDGHAYLIQDQFAEGATLVWRTGESQAIDFEGQQFFFAGTPDGWLMTDPSMFKLFQYQWVDGDLQMTDLGTFPLLKMLQTPILGASLTADEPITTQIRDL